MTAHRSRRGGRARVGDHAARRPLVRLDDGRTARLIYWPPGPDRRAGRRARVRLASGAVLNVDPSTLATP